MKRNLEKMKRSIDSLTFRKSIDYAIYGLQLQNCYLDDWGEIKKIVKKEYDINMNRIGPIVTTLALRHILLAKEITEKIKNDERIRDYANECGFPTKTVFYDGDDNERTIDSIIFLMVLRALTGFSLEHSKTPFKSFVENGKSDDILKELFSIEGHTIKETESFIDNIAKRISKRI